MNQIPTNQLGSADGMNGYNWMCKRNGEWCSSEKSVDSDSDIGWVEVQSAKGHTIAMVTDDGGGYTVQAADKEMERRAHLIAAAPELANEHQQWAEEFGQALMAVMQEDYGPITELAMRMPFDFHDGGSPTLRSAALAKARGES